MSANNNNIVTSRHLKKKKKKKKKIKNTVPEVAARRNLLAVPEHTWYQILTYTGTHKITIKIIKLINKLHKIYISTTITNIYKRKRKQDRNVRQAKW